MDIRCPLRHTEKVKKIVDARRAARHALNPDFLTPGTTLYVAICEEYLREALAVVDIVEALYDDSAA
ncbi:hypothetical protein [Burkholderia sp. LMG 21824]|uniref:hypothetical protein n=1 Tax=Burkholderia sp. LMG 21824 TaxID=3158172 RepID=UPI003C2BCCC3